MNAISSKTTAISSPCILRILILGGYGNAGVRVARLLLQHTPDSVHLILAGRHVDCAEHVCRELNSEWKTHTTHDRVSSVYADASDPQSLQVAFDPQQPQERIQLVLVCASSTDNVENVARAALQAKLDYYDIQYSKEKVQLLRSLAPLIHEAGLCFVTDGGFLPGMPAALIRCVAPSFAKLRTAHVAAMMRLNWAGLTNVSNEAMEEFALHMISSDTLLYQNGKWKEPGWNAMFRDFDFDEPFHKQPCMGLFVEELREIPIVYPEVQEVGFYVAGLNWIVDYCITPIVLLSMKLLPGTKRAMGRFLFWGLRTFSEPPYGTLMKLEATGLDKYGNTINNTLQVSHDDGYELTAIPVVATLLQYLDNQDSVRRPGLWCQSNLVDPVRFTQDLERLGAKVQPSKSESAGST